MAHKTNADKEIADIMRKMDIAREAIIADLERRRKEGDTTLWQGRPGGPIGGSGKIECPVCKNGKLRYSRASSNGHVHAACSDDNCVGWRE